MKPVEYNATSWADLRFEIRASSVQGQGVFAREPIRRGEVVQILGGAPVTEEQLAAIMDSELEYINSIQLTDNLHMVVDLPRDPADIPYSLNHSCDSNLWMEDEVTLVARRDVTVGEELTVDYALFTTLPGWTLEMQCRCGSLSCRHTITGDDWKLAEVQQRYRGHFSPFINRRIERLQGRV